MVGANRPLVVRSAHRVGGDFTFTDVESDSLVSVTITNQSLAGGALQLSGANVTDGDTITAAQIPNLVYTPAANANATPLATFDFTVNDADLDYYVAKPWTPDRLHDVVRNFLTDYVIDEMDDLLPFVNVLDGPRLLEAVKHRTRQD